MSAYFLSSSFPMTCPAGLYFKLVSNLRTFLELVLQVLCPRWLCALTQDANHLCGAYPAGSLSQVVCPNSGHQPSLWSLYPAGSLSRVVCPNSGHQLLHCLCVSGACPAGCLCLQYAASLAYLACGQVGRDPSDPL